MSVTHEQSQTTATITTPAESTAVFAEALVREHVRSAWLGIITQQ